MGPRRFRTGGEASPPENTTCAGDGTLRMSLGSGLQLASLGGQTRHTWVTGDSEVSRALALCRCPRQTHSRAWPHLAPRKGLGSRAARTWLLASCPATLATRPIMSHRSGPPSGGGALPGTPEVLRSWVQGRSHLSPSSIQSSPEGCSCVPVLTTQDDAGQWVPGQWVFPGYGVCLLWSLPCHILLGPGAQTQAPAPMPSGLVGGGGRLSSFLWGL